MSSQPQKTDKITNGFAIVQIAYDGIPKIVGIVKDLAAATVAAERTGNLGYPVFVLPLPLAFIPQRQTWQQPIYK